MAHPGIVLSRLVLASLLLVAVLLVPNHAVSQVGPGDGVQPLAGCGKTTVRLKMLSRFRDFCD